jgi:hypothetical protein
VTFSWGSAAEVADILDKITQWHHLTASRRNLGSSIAG